MIIDLQCVCKSREGQVLRDGNWTRESGVCVCVWHDRVSIGV